MIALKCNENLEVFNILINSSSEEVKMHNDSNESILRKFYKLNSFKPSRLWLVWSYFYLDYGTIV